MGYIEILKEHWKWKNQIANLALSDIKKNYSGTALGWVWAVVKPAIIIFVYWFAFSVGLRVDTGTSEYSLFLWLLAGLIPWFYMKDIFSNGTAAMRKYKFLITKMKFPVIVIPSFVTLSAFVMHIVLVIVMTIIFILNGKEIDIYFVQLPLYMLLLLVMSLAFSLFSSTIASISKDYQNLIKSIVIAFFWLSGILWDSTSESLPKWVTYILACNPITFLVEGYRNVFIHKQWFFEDITFLVIFLVELVIITMMGVFAFNKLRKIIPDVL